MSQLPDRIDVELEISISLSFILAVVFEQMDAEGDLFAPASLAQGSQGEAARSSSPAFLSGAFGLFFFGVHCHKLNLTPPLCFAVEYFSFVTISQPPLLYRFGPSCPQLMGVTVVPVDLELVVFFVQALVSAVVQACRLHLPGRRGPFGLFSLIVSL